MAPLILIATVVLSFLAALGLSALLFKYVFGFAGADPGLPLFVFVFLVALGIDYNIFLMTRVHEEAKEVGTRRGALIGLAATGGVITSAGLVLAGTFLALATLPLVFVAELGLAVALGVLLDTIVVRAVLVTALNLDIGAAMWWPSRLWRTDRERESLRRGLGAGGAQRGGASRGVGPALAGLLTGLLTGCGYAPCRSSAEKNSSAVLVFVCCSPERSTPRCLRKSLVRSAAPNASDGVVLVDSSRIREVSG